MRGLPERLRLRLTELVRFVTVGGMNWCVDLLVFNLLRWMTGGRIVLIVKVVAVGVATLFSWVMNRQWTFSARATEKKSRELIGFIGINVLGMLPPLLCLWISHHLLNMTSVLADNISANVIGLILGTILRYIGYRTFVFTGGADNQEDTQPF